VGRVTDRSAFNTPVVPYKRVGKTRPKRDAIDTALGLIRIVKGVGPLIDAAAAGIATGVAKGERKEAVEAARARRLAQEAEAKKKQDQAALQERARAEALEAERLRLEQVALHGPGSVALDRPAILDARLGGGRGRKARQDRAARLLGGVGGYKLRMPGETSTGPILTRPAPTDLKLSDPTLPGPTDAEAAGIERLMGLDAGIPLGLRSPQMLDSQLSLRPELAGAAVLQPTPIPPAPTPVVPTPGVVYPPGTPGAPPTPPAPVPEDTVAKRFYDAAAERRAWLERTRGTAIPAMEELLQMSLDELRTLAKFGLSADPRRRVAELKRIGDAATVVGRVEKAPGLLGLISGTRGGAAGRRYALERATREKAQPDELSIARTMVGIEGSGEQVDRMRRKRLKKTGAVSGPTPQSKGFRKFYFWNASALNGRGRWEQKANSSTYWEKRGGLKGKQYKRWLSKYKQFSNSSRGRRRLAKYGAHARREAGARSIVETRDPRSRTPDKASSVVLDKAGAAMKTLKALGFKGGADFRDGTVRSKAITWAGGVLEAERKRSAAIKDEEKKKAAEKAFKSARKWTGYRLAIKRLRNVTATDLRRGVAGGGGRAPGTVRVPGSGDVVVAPPYKKK
jgi:hypothetical protein